LADNGEVRWAFFSGYFRKRLPLQLRSLFPPMPLFFLTSVFEVYMVSATSALTISRNQQLARGIFLHDEVRFTISLRYLLGPVAISSVTLSNPSHRVAGK
jgi:hypothetical protein